MFLTPRIILLGIACAALSQTPPPGLEEQPATFLVHPDRTYQTITGFGAGAFEGFVAAQLKDEDRKRLYDLLYTDRGVGLNIIRLVVPETALPLLPADPLRQKGMLYNWPADKATQGMLRALTPVLARVKPIVYFVSFSPPVRWKSDRRLEWGGSLLREHYVEYAEYLADFVKYCREKGLNIDVLSLQNEPDVAAPWPSCRWTGTELRDFLRIVGLLFRREGLAVKIMAPEGTSWDHTAMLTAPLLADPESRGYIDILASHSYGWDDLVDRGRDIMRAQAESRGLPVWMSEMSIIGPPDDPSMVTALKIARYMYRDFVEANASAWIYCFTIFNPEFAGSMGVLSPIKNGALRVPKRFWAFANYSRFVRPGWKRIEVEGLSFANTAFISPEKDRFAIVALNAAISPRQATYEFGTKEISSVTAFRTAAGFDLAPAGGVQSRPKGFTVTLAPVSVTTFTGKLF